jgi:hypothetical protein
MVSVEMMPEGQLFLVTANKGRSSDEWSDDDYDVREGTPDGPMIGPTGNGWFWAVQAVGAESGTAETRESAMAEFKAQWTRLHG